jgi:hypothetical protein
MPHIDPSFRFWLGIVFSVAAAVAGGSLVLKGAFPESWIPYISAWCGIIGFVGNVTLTALNAQASTTSSRALSAAADPAVDRVIMKSQSEANAIPSSKVVGERA